MEDCIPSKISLRKFLFLMFSFGRCPSCRRLTPYQIGTLRKSGSVRYFAAIVGTIFLLHSPANAEWEFVVESPIAEYFYRPDRVQQHSGYTRIWVLIENKQPRAGVIRAKMEFDFDRRRRVRINHSWMERDDGTISELTAEKMKRNGDYNWRPIVPDSTLEQLWEFSQEMTQDVKDPVDGGEWLPVTWKESWFLWSISDKTEVDEHRKEAVYHLKIRKGEFGSVGTMIFFLKPDQDILWSTGADPDNWRVLERATLPDAIFAAWYEHSTGNPADSIRD